MRLVWMEPVDTYIEGRYSEQSCGHLSKHPGIAPLGWAIRYPFRAVGSLILAQYAGKAAGWTRLA